MATMQAGAPMQQYPGSALPANVTQDQLQAAYSKFKQFQAQGVPPTDPDFIKTQQLLTAFQRHKNLHQQQQAFLQQQKSKQLQQTMSGANGPINGARQGQQGPGQQGQSAPSSALGGSALPVTSACSSSSPPGAAPAPAGPPRDLQLDAQQLNMLRNQIQVFKMISKNMVPPGPLTNMLFQGRTRRYASLAEQAQSASKSPAVGPGSHEASKSGLNGAEADEPDSVAPAKSKEFAFKKIQLPDASDSVHKAIDYLAHSHRRSRLHIPGVFPTGIDFEQLMMERQKIIFNRMRQRYAELRNTPGNIAHWDTTKDGLEIDDTIKRKAIIEMKSLALYAKQRALRKKIAEHMVHFDNLASTTNRSNFRRIKKQSVREARITEKLEKQQRDARENRQRKKQSDFLQAIFTNRHEILSGARHQMSKMERLGRAMYAQHCNIEREEQKRVERTAKQRLQALKANDEEAYLKLLDQAKDTRITHLLRQTDGFLHQLASSVRAQQRQAANRYGQEAEDSLPQDDSEPDDGEDRTMRNKIDYYQVAHRVKEEVTQQASILVGGTLKEYQLKGLQWMLSLYNNNLNGILADEMGLGKTIQTISLITYLVEKKQQDGPFLVIVPLSTLTNWNLEFDKWAPSLIKIVYKGPPQARKVQQDKIRQGRFHVLLTTYEYIIKDRPILSKIKWFHMIIDEGHRMKNSNSKLSATIQQYYITRFRLILTGTPLQNNLSELWAMLNFVLPNIFKSASTFDEWFNTPFANTGGQDKMELTEEEQILVIRRLHKVLRPFLLRRLKKDVEKDLPDKTEKVIKCKFSALQARLYKQMVTHQKIMVSDGKGGKTGARGLSNMIMQLRKLCNHPFVFDEVENQMNPHSISNDLLWRTAGKFELLDRILPKYKATGHRVLMFFQMTAIMDIMEDFLRFRGVAYLRLDGTTKSDERSDLLKEFNRPDSPYFMFLLSTRAGGLGLNLQTADTVIIYDSDWNPHQDLQAQDRAHRIGQKNEVRILRLISANSVEEKILERARFKLDMDGKVIQAGRFDNKSSETDRDAMLRTLLETADMAESGEQEEMDDEELNMILARSDPELETFQHLDAERAKHPIYGTAPGSKGVSRLMVESELPDIYLNEGPPVEEEADVVLGRGARERTKVKYDDGLTEEQWLMAVDDDEDTPEAAAARKAARKDRRENKKLLKSKVEVAEDTPSVSRASTEDVETPVKKRGRKPGGKNAEKRKAGDGDEEPPLKKRRGPVGRPRALAATNGYGRRVSGPLRETLQKSLKRVYDNMMNMEVDDVEEPADNDDDEPAKRLIIGPFVKLPSKRDWADYYVLIRNPICMNDIQKRIKREEYNSLGDMKNDLNLLVSNCRTFNEDGSLLHADAHVLERFFVEHFQKQLEEHPELGELDNPSAVNGSLATSSSTSTPQLGAPTGGATRIKLVSNSLTVAQINGGSSGAPSEQE